VALSREVSSAAGLALLALAFFFLGPALGREILARLSVFLAGPEAFGNPIKALHAGLSAWLHATLPLLALAFAGAMASTLFQTRGLVHWPAMRPDFSRLNPRANLGQIFSRSNAMQLLLAVVKMLVAGLVCWRVLGADLARLATATFWAAPQLARELLRLGFKVLFAIALMEGAIAGLDVLRVRLQYNRRLRMSRQELREEMKETEGDPQVKLRLRQLRRARMRKRMLAQVKTAAVVVTNPTHYAVALAYDREKHAAPRVVAKGVDELALRIRAAAEEHRVPIVANPPLARALYQVPLDVEIPPEHYKAVAELIAYVWRLAGRLKRKREAA